MFDIGVWGAFVAGIVSFISPCVLPLVPPYLCYMAGVSVSDLSADERPPLVSARLVTTSIAFVIGFATVFVALGASASYIGSFVETYLRELGYVAGVIIILFGLHFLGIFRISMLYREARFQVKNKPMGLVGAYIMGLAFAFGWTPCVGPVLAAILFVAGQEAEVYRGALLLFSYAMGIGIPFIIAAMFAGAFMRFLAKFRTHMGVVEKVMGAMLVITGILFLTGSMQTMGYMMLEMFPQLSQGG